MNMKQKAKAARDARTEATNRLIEGQSQPRKLVAPNGITVLKRYTRKKHAIVPSELRIAQ